MRRLLAAGLALAFAAVAFVWLYNHGFARLAYPSAARYPVRGIDVSHHQGRVDWPAVAGDHVQFAYLKASEGADHRDTSFRRNAVAARAAGLKVGAYHFLTLCRSGAEQAENFRAATEGLATQMPPAIDLEFGGNCAARPTREAFEQELAAFLRQLDRKPVLYVTPEFYAAYVAGGHYADRPIWFRDLVGGLDAPKGGRVLIWQFAARARVDGIHGPVDLNAFVGSCAAFRDLSGR